MAWFFGSTAIGLLFGVSLPAVVAFCLVADLAALPLFVVALRRAKVGGESPPQR